MCVLLSLALECFSCSKGDCPRSPLAASLFSSRRGHPCPVAVALSPAPRDNGLRGSFAVHHGFRAVRALPWKKIPIPASHMAGRPRMEFPTIPSRRKPRSGGPCQCSQRSDGVGAQQELGEGAAGSRELGNVQPSLGQGSAGGVMDPKNCGAGTSMATVLLTKKSWNGLGGK